MTVAQEQGLTRQFLGNFKFVWLLSPSSQTGMEDFDERKCLHEDADEPKYYARNAVV
jgi:hypothetical protein